MTLKTVDDIFSIAFKLHSLGYSVIPSGGGDKGKAPIVNWTEYQQRQPTDEELQGWRGKRSPGLWGIVTGKISKLVVVDADSDEARNLLEDNHLVPHVITPRGGAHYYFHHPSHAVKTCAGILPGIDIRGDGGFVNVIGSSKYGNYEVLILPVPEHLYPFEDMPAPIADALRNGQEATTLLEGQPIPEGQRNATLASLGGGMRAKGLSEPAIEAALLSINSESCQPPLPENEVRKIATSVSRYTSGISTCMYDTNVTKDFTPNRDKNVTENVTTALQGFDYLSRKIQDWIEQTSGWFETPELDRDLDITSAKDKDNRRQILWRLEDKAIIEHHPKRNKAFRFVNTKATSLAFKTASNAGVLPIKWPLGIERYVNLFPGNIGLVAGSPNAGKTALLLNFIYLNQDNFPIYYLCSEMGAVELRDRLDKFRGMAIEDWKFEAIERGSAFADVIRPDCVNLIDYLEMTTELYTVNTHLTAISHKLGSGIAIVALQKKQGAIFGRVRNFP